jgi:2'-5' RNA ligase
MRLFVAVPVPPAAEAAIDDALAPWRDAVPGARWIEAGNRHITLRFLGEVGEERRGEVETGLAGAAAGSGGFALGLDTLGAFPRAERARVLWVGLSDSSGGVARLAASVSAALEPVVASREAHPFVAHLTVARLDPPRSLPDDLLATPVPPVGWTADRVVLFRSHLGAGSPRYEELASVRL